MELLNDREEFKQRVRNFDAEEKKRRKEMYEKMKEE